MSVCNLHIYISANTQASQSPPRQLAGVWTKWPNVNWPWGVTWGPLKVVLGKLLFPSFAAFKAVIHKSWGNSGQQLRGWSLFSSFLPLMLPLSMILCTCECATRPNVWMQMRNLQSGATGMILNTPVFWERRRQSNRSTWLFYPQMPSKYLGWSFCHLKYNERTLSRWRQSTEWGKILAKITGPLAILTERHLQPSNLQ